MINQGAAQKMAQLTQIVSEKDDQLSKMRNASETENAAKSREFDKIDKIIPGNEVTSTPLKISNKGCLNQKYISKNLFIFSPRA